jgi:hypothetical protein
MNNVMEKDQRGLERHFQTGIQLIIMGLLAWNFTTVQELSVTIARQDEKISGLTNTIALLASISEDRYREKDAKRDFELRDRAILAMDARIQDLEKAVKGIIAR